MRKGNKNGPKNWEYERFSFVAIRKLPRQAQPRDVFITPAYREYEEDVLDYIAMPPALADAARAGAAADLDPLDVFPFFRTSSATPPANVSAQEQRDDAAADIAGVDGTDGGVWGEGAPEEAEEDGEGGEAAQAEEMARAHAAAFLDEYLKAMVQDGAPAAGAIESLRLRMIDAGVLAKSDAAPEGSDAPQARSEVASDDSAVEMSTSGINIGATRGSDVVAHTESGADDGGAAGRGGANGAVNDSANSVYARDANATLHRCSTEVGAGSEGGTGEQAAVHGGTPLFMHLGRPQDGRLAREQDLAPRDGVAMTSEGRSDAQVRTQGLHWLRLHNLCMFPRLLIV